MDREMKAAKSEHVKEVAESDRIGIVMGVSKAILAGWLQTACSGARSAWAAWEPNAAFVR
jgi:hypothetical protein